MVRAIAGLCLLGLTLTADAASFANKFTPGVPYYYDHFDSGQQPWEPGQYLNFEEVFKNYQYYEIVLGRDGREISVSQYVRGNRVSSEEYLVLPNGSLQRK